jgi:hypothetical protein
MTTTSTTDVQARLLVILRDPPGLQWSREDLIERLAEQGDPASAVEVVDAVQHLIGAGLAHRVNKELVAVSWRGTNVAAAADPDATGALRVAESTGGVGYAEPVNSPDLLRGGAENLPERLEPISAAGD